MKAAYETDPLIWSMKLRVSCRFGLDYLFSFVTCHVDRFVIYNFNTQFLKNVDLDRIAEYDMKLMAIDSDTLGILETQYNPRVTMASSEFTRIVRDLSQLGQSVHIKVSKEGVQFASEGEAASGSVLLQQVEGGVKKEKNKVKEKSDDVEMVDGDMKTKMKMKMEAA